MTASRRAVLPPLRSVLAVCAHPDDESFGLGALITSLIDAGATVAIISFTHGESSTLRGVDGDLTGIRAQELHAAGRILGISRTELLDHADGHLVEALLPQLVGHVRRVAGEVAADALLVFDVGGITGHPDHRRATEAALTAAATLELPVLAWVIQDRVARQLNDEFGTAFEGRAEGDVDVELEVDRAQQLEAIAQHRSQSTANPVLRRRLELQGNRESLRWLRQKQGRTS